MHRLNVNITKEASHELKALAQSVNASQTDLVKWALGFLKLVVLERRKGNRVAIISNDGSLLKEVVLPI